MVREKERGERDRQTETDRELERESWRGGGGERYIERDS